MFRVQVALIRRSEISGKAAQSICMRKAFVTSHFRFPRSQIWSVSWQPILQSCSPRAPPLFSQTAVTVYNPNGPRTQIIGFWGPNTTILLVFGPCSPTIWVLGPSGQAYRAKVRVRVCSNRVQTPPRSAILSPKCSNPRAPNGPMQVIFIDIGAQWRYCL